jgi:hypothetical protein
LQIFVSVILTTDLFLSFLIELFNAEICDIDKDTFKTIDKVIASAKMNVCVISFLPQPLYTTREMELQYPLNRQLNELCSQSGCGFGKKRSLHLQGIESLSFVDHSHLVTELFK